MPIDLSLSPLGIFYKDIQEKLKWHIRKVIHYCSFGQNKKLEIKCPPWRGLTEYIMVHPWNEIVYISKKNENLFIYENIFNT